MANLLKMATVDSIFTLHQRGWSVRRIARALGIHRDTVARHLRQSKQAGAPPGSVPAKQAGALTGSPPPEPSEEGSPDASGRLLGADPPQQASLCEPFRDVIVAKLEQGLTAQRIYQDLVTEHGFGGRYHSVRRFVRRLGAHRELPFRRLECAPGEEAQVDFGSGAPIMDRDGKRRRPHVFRIVLSHSRKGYSEAVYRQTTEEFIRCLENAFAHFGGVPRTLVLDNLKAAVTQADWFDPEIHPKLRAFAEHYGIALLPTRPATPRHKGKIENGVGYVKDNALAGHTFASLEEENRHLLAWETTVADTRIHGTTRQQVGKQFAEVERLALLPLPRERFPFFHEGQRTVHRDGHVEVDKAYYSVPPEYLARLVWARWDSRLVRVFNDRFEQIAVHVKQEPGRFSTQGAHLASEKISGVERGAGWLLRQTRRLGPHSGRWSEAVMQVRGIEGVRVLHGLLSLAQHHPCAAIERACELAAASGSYRLKTIRVLITRQDAKQEQFEFMSAHPLIRDLADYAQLVHDAFQKERFECMRP